MWTPTAALRSGDFSAFSQNITIYDPLTRTGTGGQFAGQPFPGNIIPANRISPVARKVLEFYALPKGPGLTGNIFDATLPETAIWHSTTVRVDQKVSNANRLFVRGSCTSATATTTTTWATGSPPPTSSSSRTRA